MDETFLSNIYQSHQECSKCPPPQEVATFFDRVMGFLFPELSAETFASREALDTYVSELKEKLADILFMYPNRASMDAATTTEQFFTEIPTVYERLVEDKKAMYAFDPAAQSESEVVKTYPGFYAIAAYRIAHLLHGLGVKIIPRMITEYAHSKTGIDIHPGAQIGRRFCIDHGTGVVIGETCVIGNDVKIYQGVTLGALSVVKKSLGHKKRHPSVEDHVILYAGATVLGGETVIGAHSIIGGNTWITRSVPPHSKVYYKVTMDQSSNMRTEKMIVKEA